MLPLLPSMRDGRHIDAYKLAVKLPQTKAVLQVHTAASGMYISRALADLNGLHRAPDGVPGTVYAADVTFEFANLRSRNRGHIVEMATPAIDASVGMQVGGMLGFDMLRSMSVQLDYRDGLINLEAADPAIEVANGNAKKGGLRTRTKAPEECPLDDTTDQPFVTLITAKPMGLWDSGSLPVETKLAAGRRFIQDMIALQLGAIKANLVSLHEEVKQRAEDTQRQIDQRFDSEREHYDQRFDQIDQRFASERDHNDLRSDAIMAELRNQRQHGELQTRVILDAYTSFIERNDLSWVKTVVTDLMIRVAVLESKVFGSSKALASETQQ